MGSSTPSMFACVTFVFLLSISTPGLAAAASSLCHFPAIFNFGDSNSDTGGLSAAFGQAQPPNGESFFGGPAGRYCDGRLLIDFISEGVGLPYLSAYLDAVGSNFTHGVNFATAGSTIRPQNRTLRQSGFSPVSLDDQFVEFSEFHDRSQIVRKRGGVFEQLLPKEDVFSQALYTFDIGQNDITSGLFSNLTFDEVKATIPDILNKFQNIVEYIYGQGGRHFWIHSTGALGCLPYVLVLVPVSPDQLDKYGCSKPVNEIAQLFNSELQKVVEQLRTDLPLAAVTYVDLYSVKYSLFSHGKSHGFAEPLKACCGHGGKYNWNNDVGCGGKIMKNGKELFVGSCANPVTSVVWDGVHFTQAANKYMFDRIVHGSFSDPPIPLSMACLRKE